MKDRKRILLSSILIMSGVALLVAVVVIAILYKTALNEQRGELAEFVKVHARLLEAVARFDVVYSQDDNPAGAAGATLSQIANAHKHYQGFGKTGEIVIARRVKDEIRFLFPYRHGNGGDPKPCPWNSTFCEPMRRALSGRSGTMIGLDYRGESVVAAYEPVAVLNYGVVAKVDVAEIRAPFVTAAMVSGGMALLVILAGGGVMLRITHPLIRRMEESEAQTRAIVQTAVDGIITINELGIIQSVNAAAEDIFDYEASELIGKEINMIMPMPYRQNHLDYIQRYLRTGEKRIIGKGRELVAQRRDGTVFPIDLNIGEIRLPEKHLFAGIVRDITERKRAEEMFRLSQEKLIQHQRRAKEQAEAELEKVRDQLIRQTRLAAIGQLSASIAHELRNPLGSIRNAAYLLKHYSSARTSTMAEELDIISDEVNRSDKIITNLLRISRQKKPIKKSVNLECIVQSAYQNIDPPDGISLHFGSGVHSCRVNVDSDQLSQVMENIIRNSIEAMEGIGDIVVSVSGSAPYTSITVRDNGPGLSEEDRDRVFEPLFSRKATGTGLGLAICRQIIENHEGRIEIIDGEGSGVTIRIMLPQVALDPTPKEERDAKSTHRIDRR